MSNKDNRFFWTKFIENLKSFFNPDTEHIDILSKRGFAQDLWLRMKKVDITAQGAQLAYFFLLSFFPLLIFAVQLLSYVNMEQDAVFNFFKDIMPAEVYAFTEGTLVEVLTNQNTGLLSIGILGTIWSASAGLNALLAALNKAYDTQPRMGLINRGLSLALTLLLVVVLLVALFLPVFGQQIAIFMLAFLGAEDSYVELWNNIRLVIPPILIFGVLMGIYWIVPNTDPRLKVLSVWPGALFSTIGWLIVSKGFSEYINNFGNYSATYGSIGGVIIFMLWLYFTGILLILGGLLNASMQKYTNAKLNKMHKI